MSEDNLKELREMSREELERFNIALWDERTNVLNAFHLPKDDLLSLFEAKSNEKQYVKHLERENERLKKAVHSIYQDIKDKSWKFAVNANMSGDQIDIFKNIFQNYLS